MSTNKALFNKEKMIFYTANAFIQDLIHDMLKLADRPKGAFNASARVVQKWLGLKIVAKGDGSPTSAQKGTFFSGGKPKIGMSGGGPELLKEVSEAYDKGTLKREFKPGSLILLRTPGLSGSYQKIGKALLRWNA